MRLFLPHFTENALRAIIPSTASAPRLPAIFLFLALLLITLLPTHAEGETLKRHAWSPQVFQQAKQANKLVLLDLGAQWCQFCKKMEQTTYQDTEVISALNQHYIVVKADEEDYPDLATRFNKEGRPTTVIFDANGDQILKRTGYIKPQWMNWMLQAVAQNPSAEAHQ